VVNSNIILLQVLLIKETFVSQSESDKFEEFTFSSGEILSPNQSYYFAVRAVSPANLSGPTNTLTVFTGSNLCIDEFSVHHKSN